MPEPIYSAIYKKIYVCFCFQADGISAAVWVRYDAMIHVKGLRNIKEDVDEGKTSLL